MIDDGREERPASSLRGLLTPRGRRRLTLLLLGVALLGAVLWVAGMDAWHAATIGGAIFAVGIVWLAVPVHVTLDWDDDPPTDAGARSGVRQLSWSLRPRRGHVRRAALDRVRAIARLRLRERRLDLDDPGHATAIAEVIGDSAYWTLSHNDGPTVPLRALAHCVDRIEALHPPPATEPAIPSGDLPGRRTSHVR